MAWGRESRHARGYGAKWDRLRPVILARDFYLCQCDHCRQRMAPLPATEVDHIVSKAEAKRRGWTQGQMDDPTNLRAVNHDCHVRITLEQQGHKPKRGVGPDGWPA